MGDANMRKSLKSVYEEDDKDNDREETRESNLALKRYRRLRLASPALWKASTRRAKLVVNSLKKGRMFGATIIALGKLIMSELKEKSYVEPSVTNVRDALTSIILDEYEREKAFAFYDKLLRMYETFKRNRLASKRIAADKTKANPQWSLDEI